MKRRIYLKTKTYEEARSILKEAFHAPLATVSLPLMKALGMTLARPVYAKKSNPHYHAAAMDGIALRSEITSEVHERNPLVLDPGVHAVSVDTGDVLPPSCDAVVMIEDVQEVDGGWQILSRAHPWQHVRLAGEDFAEGDLILPSGAQVTPESLGALVAAGMTHVEVYRKPVVAVIPTGNEIRPMGTPVGPGEILDGNGPMLAALARQMGAVCHRCEPVADDPVLLKKAVEEAFETSDLVIVNAGSSAGTEDFTAGVIEEMGELLFHGISIKPGKPTMLGKTPKGAILGIPGYPVSCYLAFHLFARPLIHLMQGERAPEEVYRTALLTRPVHSALRHAEFIRVKLGVVDGKLLATPLDRGAGATMSLLKADGLIEIPLSLEGMEQGAEVQVLLLKEPADIEKQLMILGSHDILIDEIAECMRDVGISTSHVGSMGGIMAMKRGEAHLSGVHLLDPESGDYNSWAVRKYLGSGYYLIRGIKREQGLYSRKADERAPKSLEDLADETLLFANRQRGAGTRVLLDYHLKKLGIDRQKAKEKDLVLTTHTAVGLAVASGQVDTGLGIKSVALRYGLDFLPVATEAYDLIVKGENLQHPSVQSLIEVLQSEAFKKRLDEIGGYMLDEVTLEEVVAL